MNGAADPNLPHGGDHGAPRRVRLAMYLAFALLAMLALYQGWSAQRYEQARALDTDLITTAGSQLAFAQQMGRLAALAEAEPRTQGGQAVTLRAALDESRSDALVTDALLERQSVLEGGRTPAVEAASLEWRAARARLWQQCDVLLRHLAAGRQADAALAASAVQNEVDPSLDAADRLVQVLQEAAGQRSSDQLRRLQVGVGLMLALLVLLAVFVVEPTVRTVRRQVRGLAAQAADLERVALVAERTDNLVLVTGADRRIEWVNEAFLRRTGFSLADLAGRRPSVLLDLRANDAALLRRVRFAITHDQGVRAELLARLKDGGVMWVDLDIQPATGAGFVAVASDVTERRRLQEELRRAARTDALTGLPNRAVVLERIQRAIDHAARFPEYGFAVLFMDFDRFKQVNDTLGHAAGDELLRQIAHRIEDTLRPGDAVARVASEVHVAARVGGDEFVIVLEAIRDVEDARTVAHRLLEVLARPYTLGAQVVQSGASIGLVGTEHAAPTADEVLRDADTAMYEAKRAGRGRCVTFDSSMHQRVMEALAIENDLRRALREDELFVVYQPVVELRRGVLVGVEALVRWRHPEHGVVAPARFIGVAEEAGLIDAIGRHVLATACRQFVAWRAELGARAPQLLAVNLSRAQLQLPGLVDEVRQVLEDNGLQPAELELEITESLAAQDEVVQATLRALKTLGVRLSLDDFGTGYSSLSCLHQLPVDTVKIDRSFVMHAEEVEVHRVLIDATIRVARALGMTTVAEGIETPGQADLMDRLQCDRGQGYLFAKPLPADELARWALADRPAAVVSD